MNLYLLKPSKQSETACSPARSTALQALGRTHRESSLVLPSAHALLLAVPLNFFSRFFFSLRCFLPVLVAASISPLRLRRYLGSIFLAASTLSYTRQKAVLLPPP